MRFLSCVIFSLFISCVQVLAAGDTQLTSGAGDKATPDIACIDNTMLMVWVDGRTSGSTGTDIYAARFINQAVPIIDIGGLPVCTDANDQSAPVVAADGDSFLVVWQTEVLSQFNIQAARFSLAGDVVDVLPLNIAASTGSQKLPDVAYDGSNYVVAWMDNRDSATTGWDVFLRRVSKNGELIGDAPLKLTGTGDQDDVAVACGDGTTLVVYRETPANDIYGVLLDSAYNIATGPFVINAGVSTQKSPSVVYGNGVYLVVWEDYRSLGNYPDIYCARISNWGDLLDGADGVAISAEATTTTMKPSVAYDGLQFIVCWESTSEVFSGDITGDIMTARVLADYNNITLRDNPALVVTANFADQSGVSVSAMPDLVLHTWDDDRLDPGGETEIYFAANATYNSAPVIVTDTALIVPRLARVFLNGDNSYDPERGDVVGVWRQTSGVQVQLINESALSVSFIAPDAVGALEFEFELSDNLASVSETVSVDVQELAPIAPSLVSSDVVVVDSYSATLNVTTDIASTIYSYYGTTASMQEVGGVSGPLTTHAINLASLSSGGSYTGRFYCVGADGAVSDAIFFNFQTPLPAGGDDTDGDLIPDFWEIEFFGELTYSGESDVDGDALLLLDEYRLGTNPKNRDTDGDMFTDGWEVSNGHDPLLFTSVSADSPEYFGCAARFSESFSYSFITLIIALLLRVRVCHRR